MDFGLSQDAMGGDFFLVYPEGIRTSMPNFSFLLIFSRSQSKSTVLLRHKFCAK